MARGSAERQFILEEAWNTVVHDQSSDPRAGQLFYSIDMLKVFVQYCVTITEKAQSACPLSEAIRIQNRPDV
jgi:hypothetical protein